MVSDGCAVCGDRVNGARYGAPACLGCIVFFRRAVIKEAKYRCMKGQNCEITFSSRCICRCCRLSKCLHVGMRPDAIQRRDVMGPRKPKEKKEEDGDGEIPQLFHRPSTSTSQTAMSGRNSPPKPECLSVASSSGASSDSTWSSPDSVMDRVMRMQQKQRAAHKAHFAAYDAGIDGKDELFDQVEIRLHPGGSGPRRARRHDVNAMLRCGLMDAAEWGQAFKEFASLNTQSKRLILQDFGFAMMLIDQGYQTIQQDDLELWILQNGTYMCPDYTRGLPTHELPLVDKDKAKLHPCFVAEAIKDVGRPMRALKVDEYECAVLKSIILLSYRNHFTEKHRKSAFSLQTKLINELMDYSKAKEGDKAAERLGAILLLTTNIRCSVYWAYTHTRMHDVFGMMMFDPLVRDVFLT
ncbi:unnamed protein product, partial [Mesorhabditis belari]|uniref:Nuclear receptor domain-containing protein n=1 Tax=Mesorhabditis belari TaxID=2138241 RepID=A0AAF3FSM8_9BILA